MVNLQVSGRRERRPDGEFCAIIQESAGGFKGERGEKLQLLQFVHGKSDESPAGMGVKKTAACAAAHIQVSFIYPALAVWTCLKPAQNGRWVASTALYCFQLPADLDGGREACKPRCEVGVPFKKCGFKKAHHAPSRKTRLKSVVTGLPLGRTAP